MNSIEFRKQDGLEMMLSLPKHSIDFICADLPYGSTYNPYDKIIPFDKMWEAIHWCAKPNAAIALFGQGKFFINLCASNIKEFRYDYCWDKKLKSGFLLSGKNPLRQKENIGIFYKYFPTYNPQKFDSGIPSTQRCLKPTKHANNCYAGGVMSMPNPNAGDTHRLYTDIIDFEGVSAKSRVHHNQKPDELCEFLINTYTNEDDTVVDFCAGSFSLPRAAYRLGRNAIGADIGKCLNEKSDHFFRDWADVGKELWEKEQEENKVKE